MLASKLHRPAKLLTHNTSSGVLNGFVRHFASTNVAPPLRSKVTVVDILKKKQQKEKISMVTAYTYPSAVHVDSAGIDILLVGDSLAMVELGFDTTLPVTLDQMLYHCKAVSRGASRAMLVGDMPFGTYEVSTQTAYENAIRFLKEGNMDCVKLEGGRMRAPTIKALVQGGVAVMGHIGLTPQSYSVIGGFRAQGKTVKAALDLIDDARILQDAGCSSIVIECVPPEVGKAITEELSIPTIGIGAGSYTDGQVLVYHDLLGMIEHAHYKKVAPKFSKQYATLGHTIHNALLSYKSEVEAGAFPGTQFTPYKMIEGEAEAFKEALAQKRSQNTVVWNRTQSEEDRVAKEKKIAEEALRTSEKERLY